MFWNKKNKIDLYVRCDGDDTRSAYRIEPEEHGSSIALMIDGERVKIDNISANGIAFENPDAGDPPAVRDFRLHGILFVGKEHHSIPVELDVVSRQGNLLRCKICNQNVLAQKKISEAINNYQKQKIRARGFSKDLDNDGQL